MKRQTLVSGLLSLTVVSVMTGCVDDKYDLSDIDTTSRFTVDNLTVPVNISEIRLENVVNLDDNDLIEKVMIDGKECYSIVKGGEIAPKEFSIQGIHVNQPTFQPSNFAINNVPGGGISVPGQYDVPPIDLPHIDLQKYEFKMSHVDDALKVLNNVKTQKDIEIKVVLSVLTPELVGSNNNISFQGLKIQLPWGLITDTEGYDKKTGMLTIGNLPVVDGKATLSIKASGLDLEDKGTVVDGNLGIEGKVGIEEGKIKLSVKDIVLPSKIDIRADYSVSSFDIASFSGDVDYNMQGISIAPITLNDLPSFLDSPETNIVIANPQILVSIKNPVGKKNLNGQGRIILKSNFKNGTSVTHESDIFTLSGDHSDFAFCTEKTGYTPIAFDGLRYVLSNGNAGLPSSVEVNIDDLRFEGHVTDFPLGDLGSAEGSYEFNAPLGFGEGSIVIYESTENGWGSDTLDDVNINKIHLTAKCSTDLPVSVQLSVTPIDKNGKEIAIKEESGLFEVPAHGQDTPVSLSIESVNGPIRNFDGVKFRAEVRQMSAGNTQAIGPDLHIILNDIRVTVDGYYETDF
ncbi:MAG: hypothetical protein K2K98_15035 [Muribaculaceae bacterium]|nr:hypothetical protein [Muribaculaceae bacterium]